MGVTLDKTFPKRPVVLPCDWRGSQEDCLRLRELAPEARSLAWSSVLSPSSWVKSLNPWEPPFPLL